MPTYAEAFPPLAKLESPTSTEAPVKSLPISSVTQVFHVPMEERRRDLHKPFGGESTQAQIVRDVMSKTNCHIEICEARDHSLSIMVTGKAEGVILARKEILKKLQTQAHVEISIPKEHHRFVLGKNGAKLKSLENLTATRISVPRHDDPTDFIKITGTKEGLDRARHEIQMISDEQAKLAFERLEVEKKFHPFINSQAKALSDQTGTRIHIPPPSVDRADITVAGEKEGVAKAVAAIKELYEELKRTCGTVSVEVKKTQHKYVIGPRGQGLQEILAETGVSVEIPSMDSESCTVTLRGPQDKLGAALSKVYERANSTVAEEVHAPRWLHRFIIGRKGQNLREITENLPKLHLEFNADKDAIFLEGPQAEVLQAKSKLEDFTKDLMVTMDYAEVHIDRRHHRHIIGKGGANINKIKTETGTSIHIPSDGEPSDAIRIEGDPKGVAAAKAAILDLAKKIENERMKDVILEQRFHSKLIGSGGDGIQTLRQQFPAVVVTFPRQNEKSDIVQLRGPKDQVDHCATQLKKMHQELVDNNYRLEVKVLKRYHGHLIGKGGANLQKIRSETGCRVDLPTEKSDSEYIVITGKRESAERARDMILTMERQLASTVDVTINIPHKYHNAIIGPKGRLVRSVMDECGVRIYFPPSGSKNDEVTVSGAPEDVERAKTILEEMASETALESHSLELKAKPEYHKFLIGRNGANIRKVRDQFGARVIFPQQSSGDDPEVITIVGRKEKAIAAEAHIRKLISDLEKVVEDEVKVDPKYHRHFIQRRGQVIREISEENGGVIISFPKQGAGSDRVTLKGAKECIKGAKARIFEVVEELDAQVTIVCSIPHEHHRSVLGTRGANVQEITVEHSVQIKFPERPGAPPPSEEQEEAAEEVEPEEGKPDPRDVINITGRKEHCEAAKEALMALVPITVEVAVPNDYHKYIIGQRGREVRALMDEFEVQITIPPSEKRLDTITVSGPPSRVEAAKKAVEQKVEQLDAEKEDRELRSYKEVVRVDPKYHSKIIGKKGAVINKIRKDFGVQIQFPEKEGDSREDEDVIEITGYEHQTKSARDAIMKVVEELEEQITVEVRIDRRVHSRLIGQRGKAIAKVMEQYKVDIKFPRDKSSDVVTIMGLEENVVDAKEIGRAHV